MKVPEKFVSAKCFRAHGPTEAAREFLDGLASRYPALSGPEIGKLLLSLCSSRITITGQIQLDVGEVYTALGWANSIKIQYSLLRRLTHAKPKVKVDVQRGKVGVVERDVDYKGLYFRTMAQQEARVEERIREERRPGPRKKKLPIGTRVRFVQDVVEEADGEHPDLTLAKKGQTGRVTGHNEWQGHYVATDEVPDYKFGATYIDDFVKLKEEG